VTLTGSPIPYPTIDSIPHATINAVSHATINAVSHATIEQQLTSRSCSTRSPPRRVRSVT